jgi:tetratricopeptide (TPR) repeat protein
MHQESGVFCPPKPRELLIVFLDFTNHALSANRDVGQRLGSHPDMTDFTPEELARLKTWLDEGLALSPRGRAALIERVRLRANDRIADGLASLLNANVATETMNMLTMPVSNRATEMTSTFQEGDVILGRFRIVRILGRGGMGEVYEAQDQELGPVALKTIRRDLLNDSSVLRRFKLEVQLARQVSSPYICRIHELFRLPDSDEHRVAAFLTMELLEGITLARRIEQGPLSWSEAEPIAIELCHGLQALHSAGLVHRDFKPANAMLAKRGNVTQAVVMDLGLAWRPEESSQGSPKLTATGAVMGTPGYMAPEQFEGIGVSGATDIYALGLVLYEMTTGRRPYEGATPIAAAVKRAKRPPKVSLLRPEMPPQLDRVIEKCLEFEPRDRFGSAAEVAKALKGETAAGNRWRPPFAFTEPRRWVLLLLGCLIALSGVLFGWLHRPGPGSGSVEAQRWYDQGTVALREGTYLKASNALQRAIDLDKNFILAHVRLADAWNELDFSGKAKDEMVKVSTLESNGRLPSREKAYVDAVGHTITRDFKAALHDYQTILSDLPQESKAEGYVDLGRAQEKAGNIAQAIEAYSIAGKLGPEYPASFVRLAILEDRRKNSAAAEDAYTNAERLYRADSNLEGLAEIAFQRGSNATSQYHLDQARKDLNTSLRLAKDIPSLQLEIRALTRLSAIEYLAGNTDESIRLANRAVEMAQENGLEYWAIDGITRLGNAYLSSGDYDKAGTKFEQAQNLAEKSQTPRLVALAQVGLAQVRSSQSQPSKALPLAISAFHFYQANGFKRDSADALTLVLRAQRDTADNKAALKSGGDLLKLAAELDDVARMRADEAMGSVFLQVERYPEALDYFQKALKTSRDLNQQIEYHLLDYAEALWRVGDYDDAERTLAGISGASKLRPGIAFRFNERKLGLLLSQKHFPEARKIAMSALSVKVPEDPGFFYRAMGQIETASRSSSAQEWCQRSLEQAQKETDRIAVAMAQLALANAYLTQGSDREALTLAQNAHTFFAASGQPESEYLALLSLAKIFRRAKDLDGSRKFAQQGMDIFSNFAHNYPTQLYRSYLARPDIQDARAQLVQLAK